MDSNENSRLSRVAKRREEESQNNPRKPNKNSGLVKKIILGALTALLALFVIGATVFFVYAKNAPELSENKLTSAGNSVIYDANGDKITSLGNENRTYIKTEDIPQQLTLCRLNRKHH